jgi:hypothetical protein
MVGANGVKRGRDEKDGQARDHHRTTAIAVGQRADDQLQQACDGQVAGDRQLHQRVIGFVVGSNTWQRGQNKVHVQRAETGDDHECGNVRWGRAI